MDGLLGLTLDSGTQTLIFALLGGTLPPLIWLFFWLKEDNTHPEPKLLIGATFIAGMIVVPIVVALERAFVGSVNPNFLQLINTAHPENFRTLVNFITIVGTSGIEEVAKYLAVFFIAMQARNFDEPIDAVEYLITAALGFAALENTLYLLHGLSENSLGGALFANNLRFIGATLLHTASSGILGVFLAFSFYQKKVIAAEYAIMGLLTATGLHALFNFLIIEGRWSSPVYTFALMWAVLIILIFMFEWIKRIQAKAPLTNIETHG